MRTESVNRNLEPESASVCPVTILTADGSQLLRIRGPLLCSRGVEVCHERDTVGVREADAGTAIPRGHAYRDAVTNQLVPVIGLNVRIGTLFVFFMREKESRR